ncbi:MAG: asparagine synthase (glutamine-hydrolyzing) [Verrucomicrobia bacterium]|nr:asparagine synthase (glutamine-hydrolyzing) [Verrucomicrobiota bacterium]
MCGIAGYFGTRELEPNRIETCLERMHRRGPDHAAWRCWTTSSGRRAYLLFTRLSIIDLDERAHQPFRVGFRWMVYNGELYNYLELREELKKEGIQFATESDTEVLLRAIDYCGWEALDRCEGMWAFAVYDEQNGSLLLCRDRFGEKPLYLYQDESGLFFGSEAKFIQALLGTKLELNLDQICRYLVNGYKALYKKKATFFKGLSELSPSTALHIDADGTIRQKRYWQPVYRPDGRMSAAEATAGARDKLFRAVKLRLRADVPLAFCLSGGIDSNALVATAKKVFGYDVHGFTILNTDARYEEKDMVDLAVRELGIRHTYVPISTAEFLPKLRTLVRHHDAPVYTITYFAHWQLMENVARHGYHISISGTAADELFSGYYDHHLAYLYEVRNDTGLCRAARQAWLEHVKPVVRNPFLGNPDLFVERPDFREHIFLNADEFAEYLTRDWSEPFFEETFTGSLLRNRMLNELFHEAVPVILHEDDLNAMYYSIENRSPFLDRELFEFCQSVPTRHLVREGRAKAVLRDAMRGIAPDGVLDNRRKVGFNAPILSCLNVRSSDVRESLLDRSPVFDLVKRERIEQLLRKEHLPNSESKFLFYFLNSKIFLEEFAA